MLKRFLLVVLYCAVVLLITYGVTLLIGALPIPFTGLLITIAWIVAAVVCIWMLGRFLISVLPDSGP
jgi:hypothetical protein